MSMTFTLFHTTFYPTGLDLMLIASILALIGLVIHLVLSQYRQIRFLIDALLDEERDAAHLEDEMHDITRSHLFQVKGLEGVINALASGGTR